MESSTKRNLVTYGYIKRYIMPLLDVDCLRSLPTSVLDLVAQHFDSRFPIRISIDADKKSYTIYAETDDTIAGVARQLHRALNPPLESNIYLSFHGVCLLQHRTLHDYIITQRSVLHASVVPKNLHRMPSAADSQLDIIGPIASTMDEPCQIHIKPLTSQQIILDVHPKDTIKELKQRIFSQTQIAPKTQNLIFNGKQLTENNRTLQSYGIPKEATIYLSLHLL